ncbi:MAG: glycosyltransferase family 4 protein [Hyphomicrobiaceae bacterium]|nr:glycosyltransferase family 4 protein [Hyphomicrobiaceae bacterium]
MLDALFAIPDELHLPTGGYTYDRRVLELLPKFGVAAVHLPLPVSFPHPTAADLCEAARALAGAAPHAVLLVDGLAYGAMPAAVIGRARAPIIALVHHPLCLEAGLEAGRQEALRHLETAALALARKIIVTSPLTQRTLIADFTVPANKITVAEPGTDPAPRAAGARGQPVQLLSVGAIVPRKAFHLLVHALSPLRDRDWQLVIAGPTDRNRQALADVEAAIRMTGLGQRIALAGPVDKDRLADLYASADVFLMASLYEGYGMVLAEAMARGLPVVCTSGGAAAETVPDCAAIKVPPGDERALTRAIERILDDAELRQRMAQAAWSAGQKLPRWERTARIVADVIAEVAR